MKKILLNKLAITLGLILATLNLIFPGHSLILCAINPSRDFCGEAWAALYINYPTSLLLLSWPFPAHISERTEFITLALSGIIQYFVVGYLIGQLVIFIKKNLKHLL